MPIYTYECQKCGYLNELLVSSDKQVKDKCKKCEADSKDLKKVMSLTAGRHSSWGRWTV